MNDQPRLMQASCPDVSNRHNRLYSIRRDTGFEGEHAGRACVYITDREAYKRDPRRSYQ